MAVDLAGLRGRLEGKLADWRGLLSCHVTQTRQMLRKLLPDPIALMPHAECAVLSYRAPLPSAC